MRKEKHFKETAEDARIRIIPWMGYCIASDRITVDGMQVGYMYREEPDRNDDSGWRFFAGDEDDEYTNNPENADIYDVNTIAHYDAEIIPLLDAPYGKAFFRNDDGIFEEEPFEPIEEE